MKLDAETLTETVLDALMESEAQEMIEDRVGERATREAWKVDAELIVAKIQKAEADA